MLIRRGRFVWWLARELVLQYTIALGFGLLLGIGGGLLLISGWRSILPGLGRIEHVGIVGQFTPTTLPLSIQKRISLGLTDAEPDGKPIPGLASSWEASDSGRTFSFLLRSDLRWHDGKSVEAEDVNYNIRQVTFTALSPANLRVTLESSYAPLPTVLAKPIFRPGLKGFGSYRVANIGLKGEYVSYLKLIPVPNNSLPAYEYRFYPTEAAAQLAYKRGDVDILEDLSSTGNLASWGHPKIAETVNYQRIVTMFFNMKQPMLQEKSIRQALGYALPELPYERAISPISKQSWAYTDNVKVFLPDESRAKKLLSAAKVASEAASLTITTFAPFVSLAQSIADHWTKLGIPTTVRVESSVPSDYQVLIAAQDLPPDPDQYPFWHSTQTATNITGYANAKIDKLLEDGRIELDHEKRKKLYADFQRRLVDDAPALFLYYPTTFTIRRR